MFVLPLGFDTFAVSAALGMRGLPRRERLGVSLVMSSFEMVMPLLGLLLGRAVGSLIGDAADDVAVTVLGVLGVWMLVHEEEDESEKVAGLASGSVFLLLALGVSISLDELAMGFSIGLLRLSLWIAVVLIGAAGVLGRSARAAARCPLERDAARAGRATCGPRAGRARRSSRCRATRLMRVAYVVDVHGRPDTVADVIAAVGEVDVRIGGGITTAGTAGVPSIPSSLCARLLGRDQ